MLIKHNIQAYKIFYDNILTNLQRLNSLNNEHEYSNICSNRRKFDQDIFLKIKSKTSIFINPDFQTHSLYNNNKLFTVKCALYFLTLERHDDQDRIVTVIIVQVPDTFAQEALASTPPLTRRASTKILYPLYFWTLSNQC